MATIVWLGLHPVRFRVERSAANYEEWLQTPYGRLLKEARQDFDDGKFLEAAAKYRQVKALGPLQAINALSLGVALFHAERYAEAREALQEALNNPIDPAKEGILPDIHHYLGRIALGQGRLTEACEEFRTQYRLRPSGKGVWAPEAQQYTDRIPGCVLRVNSRLQRSPK